MLAEILGVVEKTNTRPLLISFVALSFISVGTKGKILADPFSLELLLLPASAFLAYGLIFGWIFIVQWLNSGLSDYDLGSWGPLIGSTILAFCLLMVFSYLATHPDGIGFSLLGNPYFLYLCTLFLLAVETTKITR